MDVRKAGLAALCLLMAAPAYADPISGYVNKDGSVAIPSTLYTVSHPKRAHYTITFTTPMEPSASCIIVPAATGKPFGTGAYVTHFTESDTSCSFVMHLSGLGTAENAAFSFIAVPMSN